jgi:hypothetical protein
VNARTRELAEQIMSAAIERGVQPSVPRVPIVVELREYAQWFGRRKREDSRGILTYLAEKISAAVEQPVLPGTLRRAIGTRSWFAVFDGLDEVSNDVKDDLAREVRDFIDRVAVEADADLFTLCTSRPQGYSGQFDELDIPTIRLTDLSPDQALACARPVVALERSENEAKKSLEILTAAIESSSVRELMKSPLQAHIMAVVVRDGGRPPERRWHLFTNFYQVIRRREANRDVAEPRLAKLLREEEQLVKTVHTRLGFILHARAETSEGAVTRLERSEFKHLVRQAVTQMMDTDIEGTVDVLMDATTERLVLVNTPDDGEHVRFDIRPLQEFFAAEFLYESVGAEELARRLEVVAGDAHWREVMHFLISGRRIELSVAIATLEALDEGELERAERLPCKRSARGSLLSARLLQEGVLEQDKRQRDQFRNSLRTLCGLTDPESLLRYGAVTHPQSREWFIEYLFSTLAELSLSENIGASVLLSHLLVDDDKRVHEFAEFLREAPKNYFAYVIVSRPHRVFLTEAITGSLAFSDATSPKWLTKLTMCKLRESDWHKYGSEAVSAMFMLLVKDWEIDSTGHNPQGATPVEIALLEYAIQRDTAESAPPVNHGFIEGSHFTEDWTTGIPPVRVESLAPILSAPVSGFWELLQSVLRFGAWRTDRNLQALVDLFVKVGADFVEVLPERVQAFIPVNRGAGGVSVADLSGLDAAAVSQLLVTSTLNGRVVHRHVRHLGIPESMNGEDHTEAWKATARHAPEIALRLAWAPFGPGDPTPEAATFLVDCILEQPLLAVSAVSHWGKLLKVDPSRETQLRAAFVDASSRCAPRPWGWPKAIEPFDIKLPFEAPLLPHIAAHILGGVNAYRTQDGGHQDAKAEATLALDRYIPDPSHLLALAEDPENSTDIRAGALLLAAMHQRTRSPLALLEEHAVAFYPTGGEWYVVAITAYLHRWGSWSDAASQRIVAQFLEAAREDYASRETFQVLLSAWRESSESPVTSRGLIVNWLAS